MDASISHQHCFRVYAEHVDFMGIVYHANYLCFFERARTELLRDQKLNLSDLMKQDIFFAIHDLHVLYRSPAFLDDLLMIETRVKQSGACVFLFDQLMKNQEGTLVSEVQVKVVCVNSSLRPKRYTGKNTFSIGDK